MKMYTYLLLLCLLFGLVCQAQNIEPLKVYYTGALKNIMHRGDLSATAALQHFENINHLYGLGALESLKGEILILDGKSFISSEQNEQVNISSSFDQKATLFVYTSVPAWVSVPIPNGVNTYEQLETFISDAAIENNMDINQAFPFRVEGLFSSIDWHVINWPDGDNEHSHEKHIESGPHGTLENVEAELMGFYSDSHHAIFTHHTTNMHIHCLTNDESIAGHVDNLILDHSATLFLPLNK